MLGDYSFECAVSRPLESNISKPIKFPSILLEENFVCEIMRSIRAFQQHEAKRELG
jgi:hypothetical protein